MKNSRKSFEFLFFNFELGNLKLGIKSLKFFFVFAVLFFALAVGGRAQQNSLNNVKDVHATDFTSDQYFEPPNGQQIKMRLSGASAAPLPNGAQDIRDLKIETFYTNGKTNAILRAPQCTYALLDGVASSPGHLEILTGDGNMRTTGDGFLWRQSDNSLTISNNVHTLIQTKDLKLTMP